MDRKEAVSVVRNNFPNGRIQLSEALKTLIPELRESEDEVIGKELIRLFTADSVEQYGDITNKQVIAWLEKQGNLTDFCNKIQVGDNVTRNPDGILVNLSQLKRVAKDKEQGDQKPSPEPKFNVGDWIARKGFHPVLILNIDKNKYEIEFTDDGTKGFHSIDFVDGHWHLWTIDDAVDGDVLIYRYDGKELIMIYEGLGRSFDGEVVAHALLDGNGYFDVSVGGVCCKFMENLTPATKEQRDLLFQKMADTGYEWDVNKKKLIGKQSK